MCKCHISPEHMRWSEALEPYMECIVHHIKYLEEKSQIHVKYFCKELFPMRKNIM